MSLKIVFRPCRTFSCWRFGLIALFNTRAGISQVRAVLQMIRLSGMMEAWINAEIHGFRSRKNWKVLQCHAGECKKLFDLRGLIGRLCGIRI